MDVNAALTDLSAALGVVGLHWDVENPVHIYVQRSKPRNGKNPDFHLA